jgi:2-methylisocitrate lyase-like PEP mutase family enzyme
MTSFKDLHVPGSPLLLPNAWDHASAAALAAAGFPALGTTSLGVAAAVGKSDAEGDTLDETLELVRLIGGLGPYVTVDLEDGFSEDPAAVAELAARLEALGAAGINLEDQLRDGLAAKITAVKARTGLFVNARTDTFWLGREHETTLARLRAYEAAGADGVFAPGATEPADIEALVNGLDAPLNVLFSHTLPELAALGVGRVSTGSGLFRVGLGAVVEAARAIRDGRTLPAGLPTYDEIQRLASR